MGRKAENLAPLAVAKLKRPGLHFVGHVSGLALHISRTGARSWILRAMVGGKRRDMGLGAYPEITLARAKEIAAEKRQQVRDGIDPVTAKRELQASLRANQASFITFEQAAEQYIAAHEKSWRNSKHAAQWKSTLKSYAYPVIGKLHVKEVTLSHILKIIEPMWSEKTETANRLRGRIEMILNWAKVRGFRSGDNPAQWRGNLDSLLPSRSKVAKVSHHAAEDWRECPVFMETLRACEDNTARLLEFIILTATRSGEARAATWGQINIEQKVWTIPPENTKSGKEHRIPLSLAALKVLKEQPRLKNEDYIFLSNKGGKFSDMAVTMLLRRMGKIFTVHGFRSTFRDWAGETTAFPREVIEQAMAHQLKNRAEAAYARGDLFTKRIALMTAWSTYLSKPQAIVQDVTPIRQKKKIA